MKVIAVTDIRAKPQRVWSIVSDIEKAGDIISAIHDIEVLDRPTGPSLVGLKWRETRTMFGKAATEVMWVTDAADESFYETRAESHGCVYVSRIELEPHDDGTRLSMGFEGTPVTTGAKILWALTGWMAKRAMIKALDADLADIKSAAEG
jgi:hypothetical protein